MKKLLDEMRAAAENATPDPLDPQGFWILSRDEVLALCDAVDGLVVALEFYGAGKSHFIQTGLDGTEYLVEDDMGRDISPGHRAREALKKWGE